MKALLATLKTKLKGFVKRVKQRSYSFTIPEKNGIIRYKGNLYLNGNLLPKKDAILFENQINELTENKVLSLILVSIKYETSMHILNSVNDSESLNLNRSILHTVDLIEEKLINLKS